MDMAQDSILQPTADTLGEFSLKFGGNNQHVYCVWTLQTNSASFYGGVEYLADSQKEVFWWLMV